MFARGTGRHPLAAQLCATAVAAALTLLACLVLTLPAFAAVGHQCVKCHTMHNSYDNNPLDPNGPEPSLTVTSCVGCHSNTVDGRTIVDGTPIVFNTTEPAQPLAGGNFYWVATATGGSNDRGHNVWGISAPDPRLSFNPGQENFCANSCHTSLAIDPALTKVYEEGQRRRNGCEGCHVHVRHHVDDGSFRFLYHKYAPFDVTKAVRGQKDPTWEHDPTPAQHNTYIGAPFTTYLADGGGNISAFCAGCHKTFHSLGPAASGIGTSSPWLRHPTDIPLGGEGTEYAGYTTYDPLVPVGRPEGSFPADPSQVRPGTDMITCVSCHRAHGSPFPSMLRWPYNNTADVTPTGSCRTCHTRK